MGLYRRTPSNVLARQRREGTLGFHSDFQRNITHHDRQDVVETFQEPIALQVEACYNNITEEQKMTKFEPYSFPESFGTDGFVTFTVSDNGVKVTHHIDDIETVIQIFWAIFEDDDWVDTLAVLFGDFKVRLFEQIVPIIGKLYGEYKERENDADAL